MIHHTEVTIVYSTKDAYGDYTEVHRVDGVPCDLVPISSEEMFTAANMGGFQTRYHFVTSVNLEELKAAQPVDLTAAKMSLVLNGEELVFETGFEVHRVGSRFNHLESIVVDPGYQALS